MWYESPTVVILWFFVRLLIPLGGLLLLGTLYERYSRRRGRPGPTPPTGPSTTFKPGRTEYNQPGMGVMCWDIIGCTAERKTHCPAAQRPGIPCWLTMQLLEGHLPERCLACPVFSVRHTQHQAANLYTGDSVSLADRKE